MCEVSFKLLAISINQTLHNISMGLKSIFGPGHSINNPVLHFELFPGGFANVFPIIVLFKGQHPVQLQLSDRLPHIIFKHSLIWIRSHAWINDCAIPSPWGSETKP